MSSHSDSRPWKRLDELATQALRTGVTDTEGPLLGHVKRAIRPLMAIPPNMAQTRDGELRRLRPRERIDGVELRRRCLGYWWFNDYCRPLHRADS
jgi:hypothetical protein